MIQKFFLLFYKWILLFFLDLFQPVSLPNIAGTNNNADEIDENAKPNTNEPVISCIHPTAIGDMKPAMPENI